MEKCMKSTIDGALVKNKILSAVKAAIKECAKQHNVTIEHTLGLCTEKSCLIKGIEPQSLAQPNEVKISLDFTFKDGKTRIVCMPIIELDKDSD